MIKKKIGFIVFLCCSWVIVGFTQTPIPLQETYTKVEQLIPMRDGVKLYTAIYIPKDQSEAYPILMQRTPYSCRPYGADNFPRVLSNNPLLMKEQYIFVFQDVRGRYMSEGKFQEMTPYLSYKKTTTRVDESSDAYDTIEWLLQNIKGNNGKVGIYGISYPGFYATASLPDAHPALKAVSPQAPIADEFEGDDVHHRGAFFLMDNVSFLNFFDNPRTGPQKTYEPIDTSLNTIKDAYKFYLQLGSLQNVNKKYFHNKSEIWNQYVAHDTKDQFWNARNIRQHLKNIRPAVLTIGGWFDAENLFGALKTYEAIEKQNKKNNSFLMMGPWTHGAWARGNVSRFANYQFGFNTAELFQQTEAAFFNYYLKEKGKPKFSEASIFITGKNEWKQFSKWPVSNTQPFNLYLQENKKLQLTPSNSKESFSEYDSDPANPVPYTAIVTGNRDNNYMGADQRFVANRPDVLSFETDVLTSDITLLGAINASLFINTDATDLDLVIKVIDVLPDSNTQRLVRAEVLRGKFRDSFEKPKPFKPGKNTQVKLTLNDIAHTFKAGHKIMVQIQSSWFPLVDRNPQQFMSIPTATDDDFKKATIKILHNKKYPSVIQFQQWSE